MTSLHAVAGIGAVNVQSNLGERFSGSIIVTGAEAAALIKSGSVSVSGGNLQGTIVPQGNDRVLIRLHSSVPINEPVLSFMVKAGNQTRQYTAMVNPANYKIQQHTNVRPSHVTTQPVVVATQQERHFVQQPSQTAPVATEKKDTQATSVERKATHAVRYHRVRHGETLTSIAARYRPHNMSIQRAKRALMAANPRVFYRGSGAMYPHVVLYIPTPSQFYAYAKKAGRKHIHSHYASAITQSAKQQNVNVVENDINNKPSTVTPEVTPSIPEPKLEPKVETKPEPKVEPKAEKKPEPKVEPKAEKKPESKAEEPKTEAKIEEPASEPKSETVASEPAGSSQVQEVVASSEPISASKEASAPVLAETPTQPEPQPKPQLQPVAQETESEGMDLTTIGLGVLAAGALAGGGLLLARRRKQGQEEAQDQDDDMYVEENHISTATEAMQRSHIPASVPIVEETVFNDTDDNLYPVPDEEIVVSQPTAKNTFNLNDFEPKIQPQATETVTEEWAWTGDDVVTSEPELSTQNQVDNTQWIEESAKAEYTVNQENTNDDWLSGSFELPENNHDDFLSMEIPQEVPQEIIEVQNLDKPASETATAHVESLDESLDFFVPKANVVEQTDNASLSISEVEFPTTENITTIDDSSLSFDLPEITPETPATIEEATPLANLDDLSFELPDSPVVNEETHDALDASSMDFALPETDSFSLDTPDVTEQEVNLTAPTVEATDFSLEVPEVPSSDIHPLPQLDDDIHLPEAEISSSELDSLNSLSMLDDFTEETNVSEPAPASEDDLLAWDDVAPQTTPSVDFVSEAVGMTAPLEAKLELAKMYLEIDDAVAARETLRELIGESSGDVQAQAKALLDELGG